MVCRNPEAIDHDDPVAILAEQLYRKAGCPSGRDLEFWSLAERTYAVMRAFVDAINRAVEAGRPFPAPSLRMLSERPELAAEVLTRAVLIEDAGDPWALWQDEGGEG